RRERVADALRPAAVERAEAVALERLEQRALVAGGDAQVDGVGPAADVAQCRGGAVEHGRALVGVERGAARAQLGADRSRKDVGAGRGALRDAGGDERFGDAARTFQRVEDGAGELAAPG